MRGLKILQRSLSVAAVTDKGGQTWQYHPRSDHHSKVACWAIIFDLLNHSAILRAHVAAGRVNFGINHEMRDFENDRKKNLDLVLCTPASGARFKRSLAEMAADYSVQLDPEEKESLDRLPELRTANVGSVLMALEAKACMTAHQRALPRLYDELNSSHLTVHGATDQAIAVGFAMVNLASHYLSPDLNKTNGAERVWSRHRQPRDAELAIAKIHQLKRRSKPGDVGYDALSIAVVECRNDGSPVTVVEGPPAPAVGDIYRYSSMIDRISHIYSTRFKDV